MVCPGLNLAGAAPHTRRVWILGAGCMLMSWPLATRAQAAPKGLQIGILVGGSRAQRGHLEQALLQGLQEQGYVEGRNLVVVRRYADGQIERTPEFARELGTLQLDAVVTTCTPTTRAAMKALSHTPIVMAAVADPVGQKLIDSLAKPGGRLTGLSSQAEDIMPRMLELFTQVQPRPRFIAVLADQRSEVHPRMWRALEPAARALDLRMVKVDVGRSAESNLPAAFNTAMHSGADAVFVLPDEPYFLVRRADIVSLAARQRLPAFYGAREFVVDGGLMSYGESLSSAYRQAAGYLAAVNRGVDPGDLPVQQPTRFELVLNAETARSLGLQLPQSLLLRADELIG
jgi:putative tryptophan/tyrosine transport system substrate-binding protein